MVTEEKPRKHMLQYMSKEGDTRTMWNPANADEVAAAKRTFDELTKKGYLAYVATNERGDKGEQIRVFDPEVGKIILVPQMRGG